MARMLGKKVYDYNRDDDDPIPKARVRNEETREWKKDAEAELDNEYVFSRPVAGYPYDSTGLRDTRG